MVAQQQMRMGLLRINPAISLLVLFSLIAFLVSVTGLSLDHRLINGELAWVKPLKFSISLCLYGCSLIFISRYLSKHPGLLQGTSWAALAGTVVELLAICVQVMRGAPSHFNHATPMDAALWYLIKVGIMPVAFAVVAMLFMLLKEEKLPPVLGSGIRWGAFLAVVGFIPGFLMLLPESMQHVVTNQMVLGHNVGHLGTALSTIPFIGWNAISGDLRIAHFVGLHALQILPLLACIVGRFSNTLTLSANRQKWIVSASGFSYFLWILLLTWQALRGESVVSPGFATLESYLSLALVWLGSSALAFVPDRYLVQGAAAYEKLLARLSGQMLSPAGQALGANRKES